jgi:hypothetical protein
VFENRPYQQMVEKNGVVGASKEVLNPVLYDP